MTAAVLELDAVHTYYGKSHILHGLSLAVHAGEIVTLLGRNGAGKTTTLRSVMGLTPARRGVVRVQGADVTHRPSHAIAAAGVGYVPEGRRIFPQLSVHENLLLATGRRAGRWSVERVYELFPRLAERTASKGRSLSGGEQEMLAIGRALLLNPALLVLDEPSQGLAPLVVRLVMSTLQRLRDDGVAVLLAEQNALAALEAADKVCVIDDGRVVHAGSARELREDDARVRALTGVGNHR